MTPAKPLHEITKRIARLNDLFRHVALSPHADYSVDDVVVFTQGISSQSSDDIRNICENVRLYKDFNAANDPYCEHDFGNFKYGDEKIYWKIDYRDPHSEYKLEYKGDDPRNNRKLTIMLSHEY